MNSSPLAAGELMLLPEIAHVLRCSVRTVRRLIQDGKLKCGKVRGRVVVRQSALLAYIETITSGN